MNEQFLCAHKCRGQLAFSVCFRDGDMFITTCTGHRVYPFWYRPLSRLELPTLIGDSVSLLRCVDNMPEGLRDMFSVNDRQKPRDDGDALLEELGL